MIVYYSYQFYTCIFLFGTKRRISFTFLWIKNLKGFPQTDSETAETWTGHWSELVLGWSRVNTDVNLWQQLHSNIMLSCVCLFQLKQFDSQHEHVVLSAESSTSKGDTSVIQLFLSFWLFSVNDSCAVPLNLQHFNSSIKKEQPHVSQKEELFLFSIADDLLRCFSTGPNPCSRMSCDFMCLLNPTGARCTCPEGKVLVNGTCNDVNVSGILTVILTLNI